MWCSEFLYLPPSQDSWYENLSYFLHHRTCPENLNHRERRALRLKYSQYRITNFVHFRMNYDGVILICLEQDDVEKVSKEFHDRPTSGNFAGETVAHKILRQGTTSPLCLGTLTHTQEDVKHVILAPEKRRRCQSHFNQ
jgi:hypothetical protein